MSEQHDSPMSDPQTHVDTDPVNAPDSDTGTGSGAGSGASSDVEDDTRSDPARHANDDDEGWESEGGATPTGPATDT